MKLKTILFGLLLVVVLGVKAQEGAKYEYAIIKLAPKPMTTWTSGAGGYRIIVSTKDEETETTPEKGASIYIHRY